MLRSKGVLPPIDLRAVPIQRIGCLFGHTNEQLACVRDLAALFARREPDPFKRAYLNSLVAACNNEEARRDALARALFSGVVNRALRSARASSMRFVAKRESDKEWSRFLNSALPPGIRKDSEVLSRPFSGV